MTCGVKNRELDELNGEGVKSLVGVGFNCFIPRLLPVELLAEREMIGEMVQFILDLNNKVLRGPFRA